MGKHWVIVRVCLDVCEIREHFWPITHDPVAVFHDSTTAEHERMFLMRDNPGHQYRIVEVGQ